MEWTKPEIENAIDTYIVGRNAKRNREILRERLIDGTTHEKLAEKYDMSARQIKNIIKNGQLKLFH